MENTDERVWAVAIIFSDNDFYSTFINLILSVNSLIHYLEDTVLFDEMKDRIRIAVSSGLLWHYQNFQNDGIVPNENITNYLLNKTKKILFNDEAYTEWQNVNYDMSAFYLDVDTENITSF